MSYLWVRVAQQRAKQGEKAAGVLQPSEGGRAGGGAVQEADADDLHVCQ